MRTTVFSPDCILQVMHDRKVLTMAELRADVRCSRMTAWRALSAHGYCTSYNFNAAYYCLADVPLFDEWGLWRFRNVRFSRDGSLTETIIAHVNRAEAGCTASELTQRLGVPVRPALTRLAGEERVMRERVGRCYVYASSQASMRGGQLAARRAMLEELAQREALPRPDRIIAVLVELLQRPDSTPTDVARRLTRRRVRVTRGEVEAIVRRYELPGKKGL